MSILDQILEHYSEYTFLLAEGFDDAVIGVDQESWRLIYSVKKCIEILSKDMPYLDAVEYFDFNVAGAYVGELTPIWCFDDFQ